MDIHLVLALVLSLLFGGVIGLERDIRDKAAGLRTHILVTLGATLFTLLSIYIAENGRWENADPTRIAAQIVTGIGFIGAGVVMKHGFNIKGITTAATLWVSAAIGMALGMQHYILAFIVTLLSIFTLSILYRFEYWFSRDVHRFLSVVIPIENNDLSPLRGAIGRFAHISYFSCHRIREEKESKIIFSLKMRTKEQPDILMEKLVREVEAAFPEIKQIGWYDNQ